MKKADNTIPEIHNVKTCSTCGNDIPGTSGLCQFCGSPQMLAEPARKRRAPKVRTVNLKAGLPTVAEATDRLTAELERARVGGFRVVRVVHGWGSSGTGGRLREACRDLLKRQQRAGLIRMAVAGDDYSSATAAGRELSGRWPELKDTMRPDSNNPGITFVEL